MSDTPAVPDDPPAAARGGAPTAVFAAAALLPLALLAAGAVWGGGWVLAGLLWITLFTALADQAIPAALPDAPEGAEFPGAEGLLAAIGLLSLAAIPLAAWAVAGSSGLGGWERGALLAGFGLWLGQVGHPAAHELIHRGDRRLFRLGSAVYAAVGFGHHASAHRLVHHPHVASRADPNTARAGEGFWRFAPRAWAGSYRAGLAQETRRRSAAARAAPHPYLWHAAGTAAAAACAVAVAGGWGAAAWAALALHVQSQILLADYVQHYGLTRATGPDGRPEPVGPRHSWNAPHWASGATMLNAPRHSDHHAHPARPFPALRLPGPEAAPRLPWPLPVACVIALVPPLWRRAMAPHLARWRG